MDAEVRRWVTQAVEQNGLRQTGALEVVKERPWATVLRAPTSGGTVYFKANAPGGRHEGELVAELARDWPDWVPAPLAVDEARRWILTADHGQRLDDLVHGAELLAEWEQLLPRYAELQLASAREPERWLGLGVPDRRLARIPELAEALLRETSDISDEERTAMLDLLPELEVACRELGALPSRDALEHGDLHSGNVLVGAKGAWFFDWADTSVSYPLCTLLVTFNMVVDDLSSAADRRALARLIDAYLEPWTALAPAPQLRSLLSPALWVAHVGRALDWDYMLAGIDKADRGEWQPHMAQWLRRWLERRDWAAVGAWP